MTKTHTTILLFCLPALTAGLYAQQPVQQNLYFVKKNQAATFGKFDYLPDKTNAFYIYRNCIYNITLQNKKDLSIWVTDIRNDSIYYTVHLNQYVTDKLSNRSDTLSMHPSEIAKIRLIDFPPFSSLAGYSLKKCIWVFERATRPKAFKHIFYTYSTDCNPQSVYELIPCLRQRGLDMIYEKNCDMPYYEDTAGSAYADSLKKNRYFQLRKWVWLTPSNANEIRGVNIGIQTSRLNEDSLAIKGVNLNADLLSMYAGMFYLFMLGTDNKLINMPDTVSKPNQSIKVKGVSLSGSGLVGDDIQAKGLSINGGLCVANETSGLVISGSQNNIEEFKGVVIGGLRNRTIKGSGVQIGLWNICKHMKGIQLGLWNVNSKRKLPLINWSF